MTSDDPPLLGSKRYDEPSRFQVENLLREARRQRALPEGRVPNVCLLDPDGDVVRYLRATGDATAREREVICIAHVTNTMATRGDDFEKGHDNGTHRILAVVDAIAHRWSRRT